MRKHSRWLVFVVAALVLVVGGGYAVLRSAGTDRGRARPAGGDVGGTRRPAFREAVIAVPSPPPELDARPKEGLGEAVRYAGRRPTAAELRAAVEGANVVICVMDAARYDHFGCHGYPRETTPNFDRLAGESVIFDRHFSQYTLTTPSTMSLLTSLYPATHGLDLLLAGPQPMMQMRGPAIVPGGPRPVGAGGKKVEAAGFQQAALMAETLSSAGFRTLFLSSILNASPALGVGGDFEFVYVVEKHNADPAALLSALREELGSRPGERFFAYLHFLPPHAPYLAPEDMKRRFAGKKAPNRDPVKPAFEHLLEGEPGAVPDGVNLYDSNLRWSDWGLGELEKLLRELGVFDETVLIVTADHGEGLMDHGYSFHTRCAYDEVTQVPLLVRFPGGGDDRPAGRVGALTQTIDVMPTVLDLFSIRMPEGSMQGRSVLPLLGGEVGEVNRYAFTRTGGPMACYVVRDVRWALLLYEGGELRALYDVKSDPGQARNVADEYPEQVERLSEVFEAFARGQLIPPLEFLGLEGETAPVESVTQELPAEVEEELRALGYVK